MGPFGIAHPGHYYSPSGGAYYQYPAGVRSVTARPDGKVEVVIGGNLYVLDQNQMHMIPQLQMLPTVIEASPVQFAEPPKPKPIEEAGITVGEIIGYRVWPLNARGYLCSGAADHQWVPGVPMQGNVDGGAGVHAFKGITADLHAAARQYDKGHGVAIGTVALWGTVVEHEHGYRAEFAMVNTIDSVIAPKIGHHDQLLARLRAAYCGDGAPVEHEAIPDDLPMFPDAVPPAPQPGTPPNVPAVILVLAAVAAAVSAGLAAGL